MKEMKLALVSMDEESFDPPLGIAYIASYVEKFSDVNVVIIDKENLKKGIKREKPDIVGISSFSCMFHKANELAGWIKSKLCIPIIIGGIHISSMPFHVVESNFDIGVIGEGEQTMLELLQLYEKIDEFDDIDLKKINGLVLKDGRMTEERRLIEPLDNIPYPARDLLKMKEHYLLPGRRGGNTVGVWTSMITARGCPYDCVFCNPTRLWKRFRCNSAKYVVDEIRFIVEKYKVDGITIFDDLFIADKKRLKEISETVMKEKIDVNFHVSGRANLIDDETCVYLKKMNVTNIGFGFESGSERILKYLKGGSVTVEDNKRAIRLCKKYDLDVAGNYMVGVPGETKEDMMKTLDLAMNYGAYGAITQLIPLPNTVVWEYALNKGFVSNDFNFDYSQLVVLPALKENMILTDKMTKEEFKEVFNMIQKSMSSHKTDIPKTEYLNFKYISYFMNKGFLKKMARFVIRKITPGKNDSEKYYKKIRGEG